METRRRSLLKTLSWRVIATLITAVAAWYISGDLQIGVQIGLLDMAIKLLAFYWHERLWARIHFGRVRLPGTR